MNPHMRLPTVRRGWSHTDQRTAPRRCGSIPGSVFVCKLRLSNHIKPKMNRRLFTELFAGAFVGAILPGGPPLIRQRSAPDLDAARLNRHLKELSAFGINPQGGVSRVAF